jgi:hypothetical protein
MPEIDLEAMCQLGDDVEIQFDDDEIRLGEIIAFDRAREFIHILVEE